MVHRVTQCTKHPLTNHGSPTFFITTSSIIVIFIVYKQFTYVATGCIIQPGRPHQPVAWGLETHAVPHGTQGQIGLKDSMGQKFQALLPPCPLMCTLSHQTHQITIKGVSSYVSSSPSSTVSFFPCL